MLLLTCVSDIWMASRPTVVATVGVVVLTATADIKPSGQPHAAQPPSARGAGETGEHETQVDSTRLLIRLSSFLACVSETFPNNLVMEVWAASVKPAQLS